MREKRSSRRIVFVANGVLQYQSQRFPCYVENISLHGALVSSDDAACDVVRQGERCVLTLQQGDGLPPLDVAAQIIHYGFGLVGLKFGEPDAALETALTAIVGRAVQEEVAGGKDSSRLYTRLGINTDRGRWR
ncbi:PilZ domain-containing protein [Oryzomonas sagensis]|uniref:PilZ domain-containing protein n=1 Tax=Oryzomonas sagensis TaxID=2603857 RepID=A0ABQ6TNG2_9BACT|nr:PilZ domain-containing protein [Oryzomonas sagensis]KAB0670119.1 PilZ domain-containing protein [Oryzomonas sagensis]